MSRLIDALQRISWALHEIAVSFRTYTEFQMETQKEIRKRAEESRKEIERLTEQLASDLRMGDMPEQ